MYGAPQRARALAVDDAHLQDPSLPAGLQIAGHQVLYLARVEGVQVQLTVYGHLDGSEFIRPVGEFIDCHAQSSARVLLCTCHLAIDIYSSFLYNTPVQFLRRLPL